MSELVRKVINNNGLKIKLYVIDCPKHPSCPKMNHFIKNPKYDQDELSENLNDSKFSPYELCMQKPEEIFNELENGLFVGYSCLLIIINMLCLQRSKVLKIVCKCLRANKQLRYKTKLILSVYRSKSDLRNGKNKDSIATAFFMKYVSRLQKQSHFLHPTEKEIKKRQKPSKIYYKMIVKDTLKSLKDSDTFMELEPENTIYLQSFIHREHDIGIEIESVMHQTYTTPLGAMQAVLLKNTEILNDFRLIQTSSLAEFYFYSINPALAIIINQYYFSNKGRIREGSDQDVLHLVRELKVAGIPYILVENCKQQLFEILNYLSKKDFWPLEKFLFFMMSHGDSKGNINTADDDKIHIMNDVVKAIQKNESLKSCTQLLSMVNCRGGMSATDAEEEDFEAITPTDNSSLRDYSVLLYSVPDQIKSPRSAQHGTPLIASLCKHFRTIYHNDCIKTLIDNVNKTLKNTNYYKQYEKMRAELVCKDTAANQSIIPIPIVATDMIRLVQSIVKDTEILFDKMLSYPQTSGDGNGLALKTTFHISGNLCKKTIELNPLIKKYFSQQLNNDCCELVEEFENVSIENLPEHINKNFFRRNK